jgi:hypothetical protein
MLITGYSGPLLSYLLEGERDLDLRYLPLERDRERERRL